VGGVRGALSRAPGRAAAGRWYADALGLPPYFDEPFYVGFTVGGFELGLVPDLTPATTGPQPLWGVAEIGVEFERLLALGATALEPVTAVGGGIRVAAVRDPFGKPLEPPLNKYSI